MAAGFAGCAGGMLVSAACTPAVVRSCAGMGTASLRSLWAVWLFCADARVFLYRCHSYAPWQVQLFRILVLDSCSMFRVPSQLVFVICFDSPALSTHDQRCSLLFNVVFQTVLLYALPRGSSACPREIKVSKGHDKRRQGHDCDLGIRSGASLAFTPDSVSTHVL